MSKDVLIADNIITIDGHACAYAISVIADDFEVSGNTINTTAETYTGHGIDINGPSSNGLVSSNVINVDSPASYGIYSYGGPYGQGPVESITYFNNTIFVNGYVADGMELIENTPHAIDNTIVATGNYTFGIAASIIEEGEIMGNDITVLGSNIGSTPTGDGILPQSSMGITVKGDCLIEDNIISSTDTGINLVEEGEITIADNTIEVISNTEDIDNHAIVAKEIDELIIIKNNIIYVGATAPKENYTAAKAYAVYVVNSTVAMHNNILDITVPSLAADWEEVPPGSWNYVRHSYNEGIVFDACDDSSLSNNKITLGYYEGSYGSIYVVDVLDSDNFDIVGNNITGTGEGYLYGIIIEAKSFNILNNTIYAISGSYANGIDIEGTSNGVIDSNTIAAIAEDSSYSIYGGMMGPVSCDIINNEIYGNAYFGVGIELGGEDVEINENTIVLEGNHTIAVGVNVDNLIVNGNTIISNAFNTGNVPIWDSIGTDTTGIKSTKGNAQITYNYVSTTGEYAVDIADSQGTVNGNYLLADELMGDNSVNATVASVYNNAPGAPVTNDTFFLYFDETGTLLSRVTCDELIFEGDFGGLGINYITINAPIKFTTDDAVVEGITFVIASDNVVVDGFTVTQTEDISAFIVSGVYNVTLSNNIIDVVALEGFDSYAVYASAVDSFNLINNTIYYVGNTDGTVVNNALCIEGDDDEDDPVPATNIVVSGNTFEIEMPSVDVGYDPDTWASTVMNDAIVFYYVEDLEFVDNNVKVEYNDVSTAFGWDSMYAVSVRSDAYTFGEVQSKDVVIANNTIDIVGHSCVYSVYVCADNFEVSGNNITSASETYLAHGIDVDGPSAVGVVADNIIVAEAPLATYGIYSYQYMGAIEDISYVNNKINVTGYGSAGMEIVECNPEIVGNEIYANGNYTYGIIASIRDEGIILGNEIIVLGSNVGSDATGDSLMPKNSMGISVKGDCLIEDNIIGSTNIGINLVEDGKITINNNMIVVNVSALIDSYGIYSHGLSNVTVTDNEIGFIGNTDGTVVNNAVRIEGDDDEDDPVPATNIVVSGNTFRVAMPSVDVGYDPDTWASTVMNDAIVFYYVEDLEFVDNNVKVEYNDVSTAFGWDSMYAVSVRSDAYTFGEVQSKDVVIANNTIDIVGHSCVYSVYVCADNFEVSGNNITSASETYLAHGIDVDGPSAVGVVADNIIVAEAPLATYGIYSYQYMGAIEDISYVNNKINVTGYGSAGMEIVECNPEIVGNEIYANGNYTYGIIASIRDEGIILGNEIIVLGSNVGSDATGDSLMPKNSMGISVKGDCLIEDNIIGSTNIGINLVEDGEIIIDNNIISVTTEGDVVNTAAIVVVNSKTEFVDEVTIINNTIVTDAEYSVNVGNVSGTVHDNYLVSSSLVGDESVLSTGDASIYNNTPIRSVLVVEKTIVDSKNDYVTVILEDYAGNGIGQAEVEIEINGESYSNTTDDNGQVKFYCKDLAPGNYAATISYEGDNIYKSSNATADIVVKGATSISVVYDDVAKELVASVINNATGKPFTGVNVRFNVDGQKYTVKAVGGQAKLSTSDLAPGTYAVKVDYYGNSKYYPSNTTIDILVKVNVDVLAEDVFIEYGSDAEIVATLIDDVTGQAIAGVDVAFNVNGNNYTAKSDENGQAKVTVSGLAADNYTATVSYGGDATYNPSSKTLDVVVFKVSTSISSYYDKNTNELVVTLIKTETGKGISGANVVINLNGVKTTLKTKQGQVRLSLGDTDPNDFNAVISYNGNSNYLKSTTTIKAVENKTTTCISVAHDKETETVVVTLTNTETAKIMNGANVAITLNGVKTTLKLKDYQARVSIADLGPGVYSVLASYYGNSKYTGSTTTVNIVKI